MSEFFSSNKMLYKDTQKERKEELIEKNSPPQQKPAAPLKKHLYFSKFQLLALPPQILYPIEIIMILLVQTENCIAIGRKLQY